MISFVVENFNSNKMIRKTPRYKFKILLLKCSLLSSMLKFTSYNILNLKHFDKFFNYFTFTRSLNKSTIVVNLSLSYYYKSLKTLNGDTNLIKTKKIMSNFNNGIRLLGLPVSFKVNNFIFFYSVYFNLNYYSPFYRFYNFIYHYFYSQKLLSTYNNLNYYYSKIYEH